MQNDGEKEMNGLATKIREYARLIIQTGVNLQPGQRLLIRSMPVTMADFAHQLAEEAYKAGAAGVNILWSDDVLDRLKYLHASDEVIDDYFGPPKEYYDKAAQRGDCEIVIFACDPHAAQGCDGKRISRAGKGAKAARQAIAAADNVRCCCTSIPVPAWASEVFPGLSAEDAMSALWEAILAAARVTGDGKSKQRWEKFRQDQWKYCQVLNGYAFASLRYHNASGLDVVVGLPEGHIWGCAGGYEKGGAPYFANLPTEEIYTSPHRDKAEGVIVSSMPMYMMGTVIDGIRLVLKEGRIVEASAEKGEDYLLACLDTDEGGRHLGEVALVSWKSPIRESGVAFHNGLFDENMACHFAFGAGFPTAIHAADPEKAGVNQSKTHFDFMVGTEDLSVTGVTKDGKEVPIMKDGVFVI